MINFSENTAEYIANALHPAKASQIDVNSENKTVVFHVTPENSRLAFGKKAQNVKLAQKLTGWKIEIRSLEEEEDTEEESFDAKKAQVIENLSHQLEISSRDAEILVNNGFLSLEGLKAVQVSDLHAIEGLSDETVNAIVEKLSKLN